MKKVRYGFQAHYGKFSAVPVWYTGTADEANQLFRKMCEARDYVAAHSNETPPHGTLREATLRGATFYYQDPEENNDLLTIEIVEPKFATPQPKPQPPHDDPPTTPEKPQPEQPETEQTTEPTKTHKKTQDTTERKLKRIFAELARIKEDIAALQMKR